MELTAKFASLLTGKEVTTEDSFKFMIALKLSRIANSIKLDSMTDLCGYVEGLWNYVNGPNEMDVVEAVKEQLGPRMVFMNPKDAKKFIKLVKAKQDETKTKKGS